MATPMASETQALSWFETFKQRAYGYRELLIFTLMFGFYLHLTRLFIGDELLLRYVVTPRLDMFLAIPITYTAIVGLLSWRRMIFNSRAAKWFGGFILAYFIISVPIHVSTYFTHSTEMLVNVPVWFSVILLPYYVVAIAFMWRQKFANDPR